MGTGGYFKDLTIGNAAIILAQSGVDKSLEGGKTYWGAPVDDARKMERVSGHSHTAGDN